MTTDHPPLYVLRHGETAWNTELRLQGRRDSPLTERGRQQAVAMGLALARALREDPLVRSDPLRVVSPRGRTRETAALIGAALDAVEEGWQADERIAELAYGDWEGLRVPEIETLSPGAMARWRADPMAFTPPGGETHVELRQRVQGFLDERLRGDRAVVIVGHGVAGAMLRGLYLGLSPQEIFVLEKPQDAFFRLHGGQSTRIAVAAA